MIEDIERSEPQVRYLTFEEFKAECLRRNSPRPNIDGLDFGNNYQRGVNLVNEIKSAGVFAQVASGGIFVGIFDVFADKDFQNEAENRKRYESVIRVLKRHNIRLYTY